jgi:Big-like domain-containing protein
MSYSRLLLRLLPVSLAVGCGGDTQRVTSPAPVTPVSNLPVASVKIAWSGMPLGQGNSLQMTAVLRDARGDTVTSRTVTWASSDPTVASISTSGVIAGVSRTGTAIISATSEGKTDSTKVTTCWEYIFGVKPTYKIAVSSFAVPDDARSRTITVLVQVPVGAPSPLPVVFDVFALRNGEQADQSLGETFAAVGYAVIHVGVSPYVQTQLCAEFHADDCARMILPDRISAARDIRTLMDNLAAIGARVGVSLDSAHVGVAGTSSGGIPRISRLANGRLTRCTDITRTVAPSCE